jgi:tetratricopeptide (TPR) repeat protein
MPAYDAFISYSHARDVSIASRLQSQMQRLGKPWYRRRALRIFRDDTSLSASPSLKPSLLVALGQTRYLVLLASPEAAKSPWVHDEMEFWLENKGTDTLLLAMSAGELAWDNNAGDFVWSEQTPLPANLKGKFRNEPRWIDVREFRNADGDADKLLAAAADLASAIHGIPKEDLLSQELIQQRRAKSLAWSAAACLLVLTCAAVWEWRQAVAQRNRAENNLNAALEGARDTMVKVGAELRQTVGVPLATVDNILTIEGDLVDDLRKSNPNSAALRRAQAFVLREQSQDLLAGGKFEPALEAAQQSESMLQAMSNAGSGDDDFQRERSMSANRIGEAYANLGNHDKALQSFNKALGIRQELAERDKTAQAKRDLVVAYERVGDQQRALGNLAEAYKMYNDSLPIRQALAAADPTDLDRQEDLAAGYDRVAPFFEGEAAIGWYDKSIAIRRELVQRDPSKASWQASLASVLDAKGNALTNLGRCPEAIAPLQEGLSMRQYLADKNRDVMRNQRVLAFSEYHLAVCGDQSNVRFRRAIDIVDKLERDGKLPDSLLLQLRDVARQKLDGAAN